MKGKLETYEKLEMELDEVIMQAADSKLLITYELSELYHVIVH